MDIDAIMTRRVVSVSMDDDLRKIHNLFVAEPFHHLLVIESDHRLVGVISDRDLFKAISPNINKTSACTWDLATLNKKAHQIMSRYPVVLGAGASMDEAIEILTSNNLSCLPVINNMGIAIGIISWKDILRYIALLRKSGRCLTGTG
jgi:acetoin utilization protein AcuB